MISMEIDRNIMPWDMGHGINGNLILQCQTWLAEFPS